MKRTLMQLGIGALEEMFATSKTDTKVLKQLESELRHRQVPRAVALLDQVQLAMKRLASLELIRSQDELPLEPPAGPSPAPPPPAHPAPAVAASAPVPHPMPNVPQPAPPRVLATVAVSRPSARDERAPIPTVSLDDACKLLKVTQGSAWQEVELARRKMVLLSHPRYVVGLAPARQEAVRDAARRVNAAYALLSAARAK